MHKTFIDKDLYSESSSLFFFFLNMTDGQMKIELLSYKSSIFDIHIM